MVGISFQYVKENPLEITFRHLITQVLFKQPGEFKEWEYDRDLRRYPTEMEFIKGKFEVIHAKSKVGKKWSSVIEIKHGCVIIDSEVEHEI